MIKKAKRRKIEHKILRENRKPFAKHNQEEIFKLNKDSARQYQNIFLENYGTEVKALVEKMRNEKAA